MLFLEKTFLKTPKAKYETKINVFRAKTDQKFLKTNFIDVQTALNGFISIFPSSSMTAG